MSKESDVAFAMESSFQNNSYISEMNIEKAKFCLPNTRIAKVEKETKQKSEKLKNTSVVAANFVAAADKEDDLQNWVKYSIKKGDSLSNIAKLFGAKTSEIKKVNDLSNPNNIKAGEVIKVPMPASNLTYVVKPGDSLSKIASKFRISLRSLVSINKFKSHLLIANQKIKIPIKIRTEKLKVVADENTEKNLNLSKKQIALVPSRKIQLVPSKKLKLIELRRIQIAKAPAIKPKISFLEKSLLKNPPVVAKKTAAPKKVAKLVKKKIKKVKPVKKSGKKLYRVKKGDTLSEIAKKYDTTIAQIKSDNKLSSSYIKLNQMLKLSPGKKLYKVTVSKASMKSEAKKIVKYKVRKGECLSIIARRFKTNIKSIVAVNKLSSTIVRAGQKLNIPTTKCRYKVLKSIRQRRALAFRLPVHGRLSSPYGWRIHPIRKRRIFHAGIDLAAPRGTPIAAAASGKVIFAGWMRGYGRMVILRHKNGYSTRYGHCSRLLVRTGQRVRAGRMIARVGATGVATGNHVHFEIRKNGKTINPLKMVHMK